MFDGPSRFGSTEAYMTYRESVSPDNSALSLLRYGWYTLGARAVSGPVYHPDEEAALFCIEGEGSISIGQERYRLAHYDLLYIPRNTAYKIANEGATDFVLGLARSPSQLDCEPVYVSFDNAKNDPKRLRKLKRKNVYIMLGEEVKAANLVLGYCIFEPDTCSYPPHKHDDQQEVYVFLKGCGAVEVYPAEDAKTFVREVRPGDAVTIPLEHYHPVISFSAGIEWCWIIAGERYWQGDRDKNWMAQAEIEP